jgi:hypothetical protein
MLGKTVRFRIPSEVYFMILERIRRNKVHGVYFINECLCRVFLKGVEVLGSDGIEKIILQIKAEKNRRRKEKRKRVGGRTECIMVKPEI